MSVPVLLTVLDTNAASNAAATQAADEHIENCCSYVESSPPSRYLSTANTTNILNSNEIDNKFNVESLKRQFIVQLNDELESYELIGLTGDTKALGEWQLDFAIPLNRQQKLQWTTNVVLEFNFNQLINYRYFIYVVDNKGRKQIRRWETQFEPRTLKLDSDASIDRFGEVLQGAKQINRGFLTTESILQLKFEREKMFQVQDIDKFDPENVYIKVIPLEDDLKTTLDTTTVGVNIEIVKFKYGESHLQAQQSAGIAYKRGDVIIFHLTIPNPITNAFALVFHNAEQKLMGKTIIYANQLSGSEGVLELEIVDATEEYKIARLSLPYVIVKPFVDTIFDLRTTYAHYWPKNWPNLDVGHRGNGRSYILNPPAERENTLASFKSAYQNHADMIELDVHLTSDGIPIIYHDFGVRSAPHGKEITHADQLEFVLIKDVSYEALKKLRIFAVIDKKPIEFPSHASELRLEHRIFPRLIDILDGLPKTLGIDVEIKWPQPRAFGEIDARQTIDKNFFIDRVLSIVIGHGCGRPLIFSSFDADICTMLRFKQNVFPVMFLTNGETKKWMPYMDLRTRSFEQAINNAQAFELAGTAPHAEDFLGANGADMMKKAHNMGQIAVVWGDDCNSKERVKYFHDIGATATCYDRTDLYIREGKERSFFNSNKFIAEFGAQCRPYKKNN